MVNEREKLIGARLRAFRETLQIPRSRFAVTIGFGSDRIASYEAGRAPLLYEVFRAALEKYSLSPQWLATGVGSPKWPDDNKGFILEAVHYPRDLFSSVYEKELADPIARQVKTTGDGIKKNIKHLDRLNDLLEGIDPDSVPKEIIKKLVNLKSKMEQLNEQISGDLEMRQKVRLQIEHNKDLTYVSAYANLSAVKAKLPTLLKRLNEATNERGTKTALAKLMGVDRKSVV